LSPEKIWASLPLRQVSRPRLGSHSTLLPLRAATESTPLTPSTITRRASSIVAPMSAIRTPGRLRASPSIHSAPARVLPNPRPAIISQLRQPWSGGGSWFLCAQLSKSASSASRSAGVMLQMIRRCSSGAAVASARISSRADLNFTAT
jgi:hypothetical protein